MRWWIVTLALGAIAAGAGQAAARGETQMPTTAAEQARMSPAEAEVWEVIEAFNKAFADNNPDLYFTFIDEEIVVIIPSSPYRIEGLADDREEFEFSLRKGSTRVGYFQELQPLVRVYGDTAVVTYYSRGSYGPPEDAKTAFLKETDVLVKKSGTWKIVHIHVSRAQ